LSLPAVAGKPVNEASCELAMPRRDVLLHVQDARKRVPPLHKRNTDFQSARPAELHSACVFTVACGERLLSSSTEERTKVWRRMIACSR
jgi:hypothetical protein